jgi:hypothetical protein
MRYANWLRLSAKMSQQAGHEHQPENKLGGAEQDDAGVEPIEMADL